MDPASQALMQRMKADWCGFGAAEHERQTRAVYEQARAGEQLVGQEVMAAMERAPGARLRREVEAAVEARWVAALVRRGDARSLALADYLQANPDSPAEVVSPAAARLQARARGSNDPMVTALALQRPCPWDYCDNVDPAQWSRLEPANMMGWVALQRSSRNPQADLGYVMDRMATEARYARTYAQEARQMLLSLPQSAAAGLEGEMELKLLVGATSLWRTSGADAVERACGDRRQQAGIAERCDSIAEGFWQQGDRKERELALKLASAAPPRREAWAARQRQADAVREWEKGIPERLGLGVKDADRTRAAMPCNWQLPLRHLLQSFPGLNDWERSSAELQASGADEGALATSWRRERERRLLESAQAASAASAAP